MKTLRIIARLNIGGPARHAVILDEGLRRRGVETLLVHGQVDAGEGSLDDSVAERRLRAIRLPDLGRRVHAWSDVRALLQIARIVFAERPDVVHTHTAKAGTLGRLAAFLYNTTRTRRHRCLVVHTFHGHVLSGYFGRAGSFAARVVERVLAHVTDRIVTISERQRDEIVTRFRVAPRAKVEVIPLGLELDELLTLKETMRARDLRDELHLECDAIVFGYIGRLVPIKDVPTLVDAFAATVARVPSARLVIVGDGPLRGQLEARVTALGLDDTVRFAGWRRDLPAVHATFDAVVLSSLNEGTPVALIEAMAAGRPVVATSVGGVADVVTDGETGILVPPEKPDELAGALVELARSADLRRRLGTAGRARVVRYLSSRLIDDIFNLYVDGLAARRRRQESGIGSRESGATRPGA